MRLLFLALITLLVTALGITWLFREPGYVFIAYGRDSIQMSLALFAILAGIAFVLLYVLIRFVINSLLMPGYLSAWNRRRLAERDRKGLIRGLIDLAEGNWSAAERRLARTARRSDTPLLNYLAAARAAQMTGGYERRDDYLRLAIESDPQAKVAVGLSQAELQLAHNQTEQALATLKQLNRGYPRHDYVLKLLAEVYHRLEEWDKLFKTLKRLRGSKLLEPDKLEAIERDALLAKLHEAAKSGNPTRLEGVWSRLPKAARRRPGLVRVYAQALIELKAWEQAAAVLEHTLNRQWDEELAYLYGRIEFSDANAAAARAEHWLKNHEHSASLLLSLGRLNKRARLWGKARSFLESSLGLEPRPETYRELGDLLEQVGEPHNAELCYRAGLLLAVDKVAEPPRLLPAQPAEANKTSVVEAPDVYSV